MGKGCSQNVKLDLANVLSLVPRYGYAPTQGLPYI
jgi:hypothetical protein